MLDESGNIQSWNTGAERISGYQQEEILGKNFGDLMDKESEQPYSPEERLRLAFDAGRHEGTVWLKRRDGTRFWASIIIMASYDASGQLKGFTFLTRDLTEQIRATEEREELAVMKEREDFMAALTHDLKNPLLGANRILELFTSGSLGVLTEQQLTILQKLKESNKSLIEMLRNLVEVYRLQRDVNLMNFETVDLVAIMDECLAEISPVCANRSINLRLETSGDTVIEADTSFIRRVLQNILDNALKFTNCDGEIMVDLKRVDESIRISIGDTGPGLTEEERERLFQRFWQGVAGQRYVPGTGLGLHVCKEVVLAHDGTISCQSELGKGTTVIIELPVHQGTNARGKAKNAIASQ
jgi:PAS domain S-box-containing protein